MKLTLIVRCRLCKKITENSYSEGYGITDSFISEVKTAFQSDSFMQVRQCKKCKMDTVQEILGFKKT